jgi:hypothetical protein
MTVVGLLDPTKVEGKFNTAEKRFKKRKASGGIRDVIGIIK